MSSATTFDQRILSITGFLRATTTSIIGISLGVYLGRLGLHGAKLGAVISTGLAGAALAAILATFLADRLGRKKFLIALTLMSVLGTIAFAFSSNAIVLAIAAFLGMLNGMGKDRGAALVIEQAVLPSTTTDQNRTRVIAVYTMLQDLGHALGAILVSVPAWLAKYHVTTTSVNAPQRGVFIGCAIVSLCTLFLYTTLSSAIDSNLSAHPLSNLSAKSRSIILRISALFSIDSLAGGFLTTAMLSYFFFERFSVSEAVIGALFFGARIMNAISHLGAAWLAKRIGLVNTMVFTHIPSSLLLITVAFTPTFTIAALLFLLREGLVEMDVPTRQSYVLAVVKPEERTIASGITNLVRLASWAVAPAFAGALMTTNSMYLPLVIGGLMKISYDFLLWKAFHSTRPPEEL